MALTPMPDQEEDAAKMASAQDLPNFSLAGTGKTITTMRAVQLDGIQRGLVLCPRIALDMWQQNIEDFLGADVHVIREGGNAVPEADFVVTTYDLAWRTPDLLRAFGDSGPRRVLVQDESHYVKNIESQRTQAVLGKYGDMRGGLAENFDQVWPLSGTPIRAFADDMYAQVAAYHPEVFAPYNVRDYETFKRAFTYSQRKQYSKHGPAVMKVVGNTNELLLNKLVYKTIGAIRRTEVSGMPETLLNKLSFPVKVPAEMRKFVSGETPASIISALMKKDEDDPLSKYWRMLGLLKVPTLSEHIIDVAQVSPVLVGTWHRDVGNEYEAAMKKAKLRVVQVNGSTPPAQLEPIRVAFNEGRIDVLIGQMGAMGVSWNLQALCNRVVVAENHPSPSVLEQFYKRVARRGQAQSVLVDIGVARNDIDEAIYELSIRKDRSNNRINGDENVKIGTVKFD